MENGNILSGSCDNTIKVWDVLKLICINTLYGHSGYVLSILELQKRQIISSEADKAIKIWNVK